MRTLRYAAFAAAIVAFGFAGAAGAQPYGPGYGGGYGGGYGPGMMGGGYGPGPGMMGPGYGGGYGPGMMGPGYGGGYGPGMMGGYGRGYGPGMMGPGYGGGYGANPGYGAGPGYGRDLNLTTDNVKDYLEHTIRNPHLKVGEVKEQGKDEITATIVTKDKDALVQKLVVNRHTGFFHPGRLSDVGLWTRFRLRHDGRRFRLRPGADRNDHLGGDPDRRGGGGRLAGAFARRPSSHDGADGAYGNAPLPRT